VPYSRLYSTCLVEAGSLPCLRTGTKPTPSLVAKRGPKMKPRASGPTTASGRQSRSFMSAAKRSVMSDRRPGTPSTGVISRNIIPSRGKSGTVRIASRRLRSNSSDMLSACRGRGPGLQAMPSGPGFPLRNSHSEYHSEYVLERRLVAGSQVEHCHQCEQCPHDWVQLIHLAHSELDGHIADDTPSNSIRDGICERH